MAGALDGLLVVALEQAVAAPMASRRLADAGARVIKLERPEGDFARGYDAVVHGESAYFVWLNRGKESVAIDLARDDDRRLFEALLTKADVFIQNLKPGALAKLGWPLETLVARYPRLILCSISGFGESGPYAARKAYDLLIQAESGLASVTGGPEAPSRVGVSVVDIATGLNAYEAILEAVIRRGRTGIGADIRVSMFDAMAEWMAVPLLHGEHGTAPKRVGLSHPVVAPYGVFGTADGGQILISIQNDREWQVFARDILGDAALGKEARFAKNLARVANRAATDQLVVDAFKRIAIAPLIERLTQADIAFGRLSEVADLLVHPHLRRVEIGSPTGPVQVPAPAAREIGTQPRFAAVPGLGDHTAAVRREFLGAAD